MPNLAGGLGTQPVTRMSFQIRLNHLDGGQVAFSGEPEVSIARSAALAGIQLTTGCLQGRCAICRAYLQQGSVRLRRRPSPSALTSPLARTDGTVLLCAIVPLSAVELTPLSPWTGPV